MFLGSIADSHSRLPVSSGYRLSDEEVRIPTRRNRGLLKNLALDFDFYLAHNMVSARYDKKWRIYYPSNFG